jgi:hypothetical protein
MADKEHAAAVESAAAKAPKAAAAADPGLQEVQDRVAKEQEQGFRGIEVDQTPNSAYTVDGVTSGAETPETTKEPAQ